MPDPKLNEDAVNLLKALIEIPSFSKEEDITADLIAHFLEVRGAEVYRELNNVWAFNRHYDATKPTLLLNSHHDTVKPNPGWTRDPFAATEEDGKLYGLGSNDAGGCLVSLIATFLHLPASTDNSPPLAEPRRSTMASRCEAVATCLSK